MKKLVYKAVTAYISSFMLKLLGVFLWTFFVAMDAKNKAEKKNSLCISRQDITSTFTSECQLAYEIANTSPFWISIEKSWENCNSCLHVSCDTIIDIANRSIWALTIFFIVIFAIVYTIVSNKTLKKIKMLPLLRSKQKKEDSIFKNTNHAVIEELKEE